MMNKYNNTKNNNTDSNNLINNVHNVQEIFN